MQPWRCTGRNNAVAAGAVCHCDLDGRGLTAAAATRPCLACDGPVAQFCPNGPHALSHSHWWCSGEEPEDPLSSSNSSQPNRLCQSADLSCSQGQIVHIPIRPRPLQPPPDLKRTNLILQPPRCQRMDGSDTCTHSHTLTQK